MNSVLLDLGFLQIRWYSFLILIAAVVVFSLAIKEAKKFNVGKDFMFNLMFWCLIFGIIGARIYYVIFNWGLYTSDFFEIFKVWNGGLAIHGGIIGGLITLLLYCKKYQARSIRIIDFIVVPLILGQAIGRWGNFFNQEAHGAPIALSTLKSLFVPDFVIKGMYIDGTLYSPTFYFESIACFVAFLLLLGIRRYKYTKVGTPTACYLLMYGAIRFFIETSRTDALMLGGFKVAQIISVLMVLLGIGILMYQSRRGKFDDLYNDKTNIENIRF